MVGHLRQPKHVGMPGAAFALLSPGAAALPAPWELAPAAGGGTGGPQREDGARARAAQAPLARGVSNLDRQFFTATCCMVVLRIW